MNPDQVVQNEQENEDQKQIKTINLRLQELQNHTSKSIGPPVSNQINGQNLNGVFKIQNQQTLQQDSRRENFDVQLKSKIRLGSKDIVNQNRMNLDLEKVEKKVLGVQNTKFNQNLLSQDSVSSSNDNTNNQLKQDFRFRRRIMALPQDQDKASQEKHIDQKTGTNIFQSLKSDQQVMSKSEERSNNKMHQIDQKQMKQQLSSLNSISSNNKISSFNIPTIKNDLKQLSNFNKVQEVNTHRLTANLSQINNGKSQGIERESQKDSHRIKIKSEQKQMQLLKFTKQIQPLQNNFQSLPPSNLKSLETKKMIKMEQEPSNGSFDSQKLVNDENYIIQYQKQKNQQNNIKSQQNILQRPLANPLQKNPNVITSMERDQTNKMIQIPLKTNINLNKIISSYQSIVSSNLADQKKHKQQQIYNSNPPIKSNSNIVIFHPHPLNNNIKNMNQVALKNKIIVMKNSNASPSQLHQQTKPSFSQIAIKNDHIDPQKSNFNVVVKDSARAEKQELINDFSFDAENQNLKSNLRTINSQAINNQISPSNIQQALMKKNKNGSYDKFQSQLLGHSQLNNQQIEKNLQFQGQASQRISIPQKDMISASTSNERALATGNIHFNKVMMIQKQMGQTQYLQPQQRQLETFKNNYHSGLGGLQQKNSNSQQANITNKNVLFNQKKNSQTINNQVSHIGALNMQKYGEQPAIGPLFQNNTSKHTLISITKTNKNQILKINNFQNTQPIKFSQFNDNNQNPQLNSYRSSGGIQYFNNQQDININRNQIIPIYDDKHFQQIQQKQMGNKKQKKSSQVQIIKKDQILQQQFQKQDDSKSKSIENNYQTEQKLENKIQEMNKLNEQSLAQNSLFQNSRNIDFGQGTNEISSINEPVQNGISGLSGLENLLQDDSKLSQQKNKQTFNQSNKNQVYFAEPQSNNSMKQKMKNPTLNFNIKQNPKQETEIKTCNQSSTMLGNLTQNFNYNQTQKLILNQNLKGINLGPEIGVYNVGHQKLFSSQSNSTQSLKTQSKPNQEIYQVNNFQTFQQNQNNFNQMNKVLFSQNVISLNKQVKQQKLNDSARKNKLINLESKNNKKQQKNSQLITNQEELLDLEKKIKQFHQANSNTIQNEIQKQSENLKSGQLTENQKVESANPQVKSDFSKTQKVQTKQLMQDNIKQNKQNQLSRSNASSKIQRDQNGSEFKDQSYFSNKKSNNFTKSEDSQKKATISQKCNNNYNNLKLNMNIQKQYTIFDPTTSSKINIKPASTNNKKLEQSDQSKSFIFKQTEQSDQNILQNKNENQTQSNNVQLKIVQKVQQNAQMNSSRVQNNNQDLNQPKQIIVAKSARQPSKDILVKNQQKNNVQSNLKKEKISQEVMQKEQIVNDKPQKQNEFDSGKQPQNEYKKQKSQKKLNDLELENQNDQKPENLTVNEQQPYLLAVSNKNQQNIINESQLNKNESLSLDNSKLITIDQNQQSNGNEDDQPYVFKQTSNIVNNDAKSDKELIQSKQFPNNQGDANYPVQEKKFVKVQNKMIEQRTTNDTNSHRKQQNNDSQQRTNFNHSMQNIPRGLINTAFSLNSVASKEQVPQLPTTPQNILKYYIDQLTDFEKGEILDYEMIYFIGKSKANKVDCKQTQLNTEKASDEQQTGQDPSSSSTHEKDDQEKKKEFKHNNGFDDANGDYKVVIGDHVGYRYEIVEFLGKGSFGTALGCIDHKDKAQVAVKIVKNKKKYYYQASVELKILQYLREHDYDDIMNVIHIEDYVVFRKHLCMSFEKLSMNLFEFLKINDFNGFDHNLIRRFAIQLLYALKYLKQLEIIHCDLKPENILLKEENKSGIKIIDFGSSTFTDEKVYTYIQSRFYRAPEIMLGIPYTTAIDMWSLGCIMAELYIGFPIFPGESENDQMSRIIEMRDIPSKEVLAKSERKMKFFNYRKDHQKFDPIMVKNSRGKLRKPYGKPLELIIGDEDPDFNDFVEKCLDWNPDTRLTPDDALKHIWVLKGLPPQVLIHHQKMHNILTPELPQTVKVARDEFIIQQQRELELKQQPRQRYGTAQAREISQNPGVARPKIQLKTPKSNLKQKTFQSEDKN